MKTDQRRRSGEGASSSQKAFSQVFFITRRLSMSFNWLKVHEICNCTNMNKAARGTEGVESDHIVGLLSSCHKSTSRSPAIPWELYLTQSSMTSLIKTHSTAFVDSYQMYLMLLYEEKLLSPLGNKNLLFVVSTSLSVAGRLQKSRRKQPSRTSHCLLHAFYS